MTAIHSTQDANAMPFDSISDIIDDIRAGRMVVMSVSSKRMLP
mgnify:CR=1 FL=1